MRSLEMPKSPAFELFEVVCRELAARENMILPEDDVPPDLVEDLREHYRETSDRQAFLRAIQEVTGHFAWKGSIVPFGLDSAKSEFTTIDNEYISFIAAASNRRGLGGDDAKVFEIETMQRLARRLTGALHRVGKPRDHNKKKAEFLSYLRAMGFRKDSLEPRDQDGGFDILWLPPLGTIPIRPVVSLQCKNSFFNEAEANQSAGRAIRTLNRHSHVGSHQLVFVVFNDYIDDSFVRRSAGWIFIPLGLSDLGIPAHPLETYIL